MAPRKSAAPTEATVRTVLEKCIDPEVGVDIINLGLVYRVTITKQQIDVLMTLTTPGCPLAPYFLERIPELLHDQFPKASTKVDITFDPPWSPEKMSPSARLFLGR